MKGKIEGGGRHRGPSMLSNWVVAPLEFHKAFSLKIIKMRQAFKIKQRGNLIVLKRRERTCPPVPHYFSPFSRPLSLRMNWFHFAIGPTNESTSLIFYLFIITVDRFENE